VQALERPSLAARLSDLAGKPVGLMRQALPPGASKVITVATARALRPALKVALRTLRNGPELASPRLHKSLAAGTGAIGGSFGLVWGFFCQGVRHAGASFILHQFLCSIRKPFLRPDPRFAHVVARRSCQGWPSRHAPPLPGHTLTASSTMARLVPRDDDQRGARFRARINRATTLYPVGPRTRTMMQPCASAAKLRSGGPILFLGITARAQTGTRHLEPSSTTRHKRTDWAETVGCLQFRTFQVCPKDLPPNVRQTETAGRCRRAVTAGILAAARNQAGAISHVRAVPPTAL
jgi:hypothetical protein